MMKRIYELNEEEIKTILASHFSVKPNDVTLKTEKVTVGYGMGEHTENQIVAEVTEYGVEVKDNG